MHDESRRDRPTRQPWWMRHAARRDYLVTPFLFAVSVGFSLATVNPVMISIAKVVAINIALIGLVIVCLRLNRYPDPVPEKWSDGWGGVFVVHCVTALGSLSIIHLRSLLIPAALPL